MFYINILSFIIKTNAKIWQKLLSANFFDKNLMFFVKTQIYFFRSPIIENFPKGINFG